MHQRSVPKYCRTLNHIFQKFNRQYLGFIDSNGNKNLIIHLFDYSNKHIVNKFLGDSWKNKFVIFFF